MWAVLGVMKGIEIGREYRILGGVSEDSGTSGGRYYEEDAPSKGSKFMIYIFYQ